MKERKEVGNGWKGEGARVELLGVRKRRKEKVKRQERSSGRLKYSLVYLSTCESSGVHIS